MAVHPAGQAGPPGADGERFFQFCVAGVASGVGKTTVTLGLMAALRRRGWRLQPFKCGPDYIDPGHHTLVCGRPSRNLDTWMMGPEAVRDCFARHCRPGIDGAVVEGVMGLFDGAAADSLDGSTAHVARLLQLPVFLVVDARAMARSLAALVSGFAAFEPGVEIAGVIANRVGGPGHAAILRRALAAAGLPPLVGALPRRADWQLPERHLGLVTVDEDGRDCSWYEQLGAAMEEHLDLERLVAISSRPRPAAAPAPAAAAPRVRLGIARDAAFCFYYQDNLDLLRQHGVELVPFSPLADARLPAGIAGVYLGGGFPEMFARQLAANESLRRELAALAAAGGVIYAECGGFMYLCRQLVDRDGRRWPMCGIVPATAAMESRLHRLGYVEVRTAAAGLCGPAGTLYRGHEFHWSSMTGLDGCSPAVFRRRPRGGDWQPEGYHRDRVWGTYVHAHFASNPALAAHWAAFLAG
ncbi:MAG: cobyrinate a,c-diamide synthase [Deltaproteobacteria bacterium]|nr:cobyrinate a,c-diamide synthase [Deltaproteobacteria bacterium]